MGGPPDSHDLQGSCGVGLGFLRSSLPVAVGGQGVEKKSRRAQLELHFSLIIRTIVRFVPRVSAVDQKNLRLPMRLMLNVKYLVVVCFIDITSIKNCT